MKQELKRIEAALHQIADRRNNRPTEVLSSQNMPVNEVLKTATDRSDAELPDQSSAPGSATRISLPAFSSSKASAAVETVVVSTSDSSPQVLSTNFSETKTLALPKLKSPTFTSHRNAANPSLTMNLLKEMEDIVAGWQEELQQALKQIQDLYLEGPIIDGWLESYAHQEGEAPAFRHADIDCLMDYVEKMRGSMPQETAPSAPSSSEAGQGMPELNFAGYRLCGPMKMVNSGFAIVQRNKFLLSV